MRLRLYTAIVLLAVLAAVACSAGENGAPPPTVTAGPAWVAPSTSDAPQGGAVSPTTTGAPAVPEDSPEALLDSLSIRQKAAQVLLVGFPGKEVDPALAELIREGPPAGVILFGRNVGLPEETRALTAALQRQAAQSPAGLPLLVAVDQEGGTVARLREGVPRLPSARQIASTQTPDEAERSAYQVGLALRGLGVNLNLAPVLDLVADPDSFLYERSYGSAPDTVSAFGLAMIRGYAASGIIASAKHFPGHGSASGDTHGGLVRSTLSRAALGDHLTPFEAAVQAGVPTIMVSHVVVDAFDPELPASLSPQVVNEILRNELGFQGVALSDDLEMVGVLQGMTIGEATVQALKAGGDLLIVGGHEHPPEEARDALVQAVQEGTVDEARLDEAVLRVLRLKQQFGLLPLGPKGSSNGSDQ